MRLDTRITIEKFKGSKITDNGFNSPSFEPYYSCWSKKIQVKGSEYIAAKTTNSENIITFTVRYCEKIKTLLIPGATKKYRVSISGFIYDILYINDFENKKKWVDIKCQISS